MYFYSDLKCSVRSSHVTNDVTTTTSTCKCFSYHILSSYQILFLSALNAHSYRLITSPLRNAPVQSHLNFQMPDVNWQFPNFPFQ